MAQDNSANSNEEAGRSPFSTEPPQPSPSIEQSRFRFEPQAVSMSTDQWAAHPLDPELLAALEDEDPQVREAAVEFVGVDGDPDTVKLLLEKLHDPSQMVRAAAAEALGWMRNTQSLPLLSGALHDPSDLVRAAAARALGRCLDPSALQELKLLAHSKNSSL